MRINSEALKQLDALRDALKEDDDDLAVLNRIRAARGEPPLTALDFDEFDAFMRDPSKGPLVL